MEESQYVLLFKGKRIKIVGELNLSQGYASLISGTHEHCIIVCARICLMSVSECLWFINLCPKSSSNQWFITN